MTRVLWSRRQLDRDGAPNDATLVAFVRRGLGRPPGGSFEELFRRHYPAIRSLLDGRREPGLALLAVGSDAIEASGWFAAKDGEINALIVGRHSHADIFLPGDRRLSLRHLAVVLHAREAGAAPAFRVLDLRTPLAFTDEEGSPLEAVEAKGPVLLRCASVGLLLFPTGGAVRPWPEDPAAAWSRVPPRLCVEKTPAGSSPGQAANAGAWVAPPASADWSCATLVRTLRGPVLLSPAIEGSEPARGELLVTSSEGRVAVRVDSRAARRGLLLGRYDRCDTAGVPVLSHPSLSRVHLLVLEIDGTLYAIDTASRNGSRCGGEPVRVTRIRPGLPVSLAGKATVEWRSIH
ncbi:MAG TPA: FHA domain-containing protein [Vicinamibacteria bacterium]|nr:FHA domain-containing protein [Vicinamibacteria bacterium]